jgi:hypothetical protein
MIVPLHTTRTRGCGQGTLQGVIQSAGFIWLLHGTALVGKPQWESLGPRILCDHARGGGRNGATVSGGLAEMMLSVSGPAWKQIEHPGVHMPSASLRATEKVSAGVLLLMGPPRQDVT